MNTSNITKLEQCRQIAADLKWNETHAEANARILISKADSLGIDTYDVIRLIFELPGASYVRQNIHILLQAANTVARRAYYATHPADQFELLLDGELN